MDCIKKLQREQVNKLSQHLSHANCRVNNLRTVLSFNFTRGEGGGKLEKRPHQHQIIYGKARGFIRLSLRTKYGCHGKISLFLTIGQRWQIF